MHQCPHIVIAFNVEDVVDCDTDLAFGCSSKFTASLSRLITWTKNNDFVSTIQTRPLVFDLLVDNKTDGSNGCFDFMCPLDHYLKSSDARILGLFLERGLASQTIAPVFGAWRLKVLIWCAPCTLSLATQTPVNDQIVVLIRVPEYEIDSENVCVFAVNFLSIIVVVNLRVLFRGACHGRIDLDLRLEIESRGLVLVLLLLLFL